MKTKPVHLLIQLLVLALVTSVSCTDDVPVVNADCRLLRLGDFTSFNYDSIEYRMDGTIANVWRIQPGGMLRFEYRRNGSNIHIYQSSSQVDNYHLGTIELNEEGHPVSRREHGTVYEQYFYEGGRLKYKTWPSKDSIVFTYTDNSRNPQSRTFYHYLADSKSWIATNTVTYTFDNRPNPLKGMILPIENWNLEFYFFDSNCTGYIDGNNLFSLSYEYNSKNLPVARTLTFTGFSETRSFDYDCD